MRGGRPVKSPCRPSELWGSGATPTDDVHEATIGTVGGAPGARWPAHPPVEVGEDKPATAVRSGDGHWRPFRRRGSRQQGL
jgi:hypothetical protein